ncbi:biopolymer transporter ExbD [Candidatus Fermentibacteria bacterium]|nr:biopolymer transporter ExbD [Candidatus Fermentibacteria bacterium]
MKRRTRVAAEIPTASMADIAFLLLVFFLVTTNFMEEKGLGLILPEPTTDPSVSVRIPKKNMMYFIVYAKNRVVMKHQDEERQMPVSEIRGFVRSSLELNENLIVSLKPAPDAPYEAMIDVLDELRAADAKRISLSQLKPTEG